MKTNQEMVRVMGSFNVVQRTKDGMFNATNLLKQWNHENPNEKRELDNFWKSTNLDKLMSEIVKNELGFTSVDFTHLKNALAITSKARNDRGGGTWMHPILFIKFAMYLSPRFEYHVLKFVSDEMIRYRNDAGDAYKMLCASIQKIVPKSFMPIAMKKIGEALNWCVFNSHEKLLRNKHGNELKQRELYMLEQKVSDLIEDGFILKYDQVVDYLRMQYRKRWEPKVLSSSLSII